MQSWGIGRIWTHEALSTSFTAKQIWPLSYDALLTIRWAEIEIDEFVGKGDKNQYKGDKKQILSNHFLEWNEGHWADISIGFWT